MAFAADVIDVGYGTLRSRIGVARGLVDAVECGLSVVRGDGASSCNAGNIV